MMHARLSASAMVFMLALTGCQKDPAKPAPAPTAEGSLGFASVVATTACTPVTALKSLCTKFNESRCQFEICPGDQKLWVDFDDSTNLANLKAAELLDVRSQCLTTFQADSPGVPFWEYMRGRWRPKENRRRVTTLPMSDAKAVPDPAFISIAYENDQSDKTLIREIIVPLPDGMPADGGLSFEVNSNDASPKSLTVNVRNGDGSKPIPASDLTAVVWVRGGTFETQPVKDIPGLAAKIECMRYEANVTRGLNKAFTRNCTPGSTTGTPPSQPQARRGIDSRLDLTTASSLRGERIAATPEPISSRRAMVERSTSTIVRRASNFDASYSRAFSGPRLLAASPTRNHNAQPPAKAAPVDKAGDGTESGLLPAQVRPVEGPEFHKDNCTLPAGKPPDIKATYQDAVAPSKLHMATMRYDTSSSVAGSGSTTPPAPFWEYIRGRWRSHGRGRTKTLPMSGTTTDLAILTFTQHISSTKDAQWVVLLADGIDSAREEKVTVTVTGSVGPPTVIELKAKGGTLVKDLEVVESLDAGVASVKKKVSDVIGLEPIINEARELARKKNFDKAFARACPDQPSPPRPSGQ